jgi:hypothetical protein
VEAFVRIRNALVHPKAGKRKMLAGIQTDARADAWVLGLWYLELAVLFLCDYRSVYYQRIRGGSPADLRSRVPWVTPDSRDSRER